MNFSHTGSSAPPSQSVHVLEVFIKTGDLMAALPNLDGPLIRQAHRSRLGLVHAAMQLKAPVCRIRALVALMDLGADVSAHNMERASPLHEAVDRLDLEGMALLIALGADINAQNGKGQTPLHISARRGRVGPATRLISAGANVGVRDDAGKTFLEHASVSFVEHMELLMDVRKTIRHLDTKVAVFKKSVQSSLAKQVVRASEEDKTSTLFGD